MIVNTISDNYRYERKCRIDNHSKQQILYHIKHHPAFFHPLFHPRQINNIYLDTPQLQYYLANKIGIAARKKIRIRWYGVLDGQYPVAIKQPQLEIKRKQGLVGDKLVFSLPDFDWTNDLSADIFVQLAIKGDVNESIIALLKTLRPTLFNTYWRSYYQSADKKFRLTFDENMDFAMPKKITDYSPSNSLTNKSYVIELKYLPVYDGKARKIFQHLPYRLSKNSKYINGIDRLYPQNTD